MDKNLSDENLRMKEILTKLELAKDKVSRTKMPFKKKENHEQKTGD